MGSSNASTLAVCKPTARSVSSIQHRDTEEAGQAAKVSEGMRTVNLEEALGNICQLMRMTSRMMTSIISPETAQALAGTGPCEADAEKKIPVLFGGILYAAALFVHEHREEAIIPIDMRWRCF